MSKKKKRKTKKQKNNSINRRLQELEVLKEKVSEYENKISEQKKNNFKEFNIRNLKIFAGTCNLLLPFVVIGGVAVGGFKVCNGGLPFYRDDITKYKKYELEYETNADINANIEYVRNEWWTDALPSDSLTICTPWEKEGDSYVRYKREYDLPDDCFSDLYEAIFKKDYDYIEKNYEKSKEEKEVSNFIIDDVNDHIVEAKLYKIDSDDFIKFPESAKKNKIITIIQIIITLGVGGFIVHVRDFDYLDYLKEANEDYHSNKKPIGPLEDELEATKKKILTLTGGIGGVNNGK